MHAIERSFCNRVNMALDQGIHRKLSSTAKYPRVASSGPSTTLRYARDDTGVIAERRGRRGCCRRCAASNVDRAV